MGSSQSNFLGQIAVQFQQKKTTAIQTHLPNETFADIFTFLPNDDIVLNVVFVSRRFSEISFPILRRRFAEATSSWVKQFDDPLRKPSCLHKLRRQKVLLQSANVYNYVNPPKISGTILAKTFHRMNYSLLTIPHVRVFLKVGHQQQRRHPFVTRHSISWPVDGFCEYNFSFPVPKNTNRESQIEFHIEYYANDMVYTDDNDGECYIFKSRTMKGRVELIIRKFCSFGQFIILPIKCFWHLMLALRNAFRQWNRLDWL